MELLPPNLQRLKDQIVIITGASRGIGKATALALATEGAKIVVNYASNSQSAEAVVAEITEAGGEAIAIGADVSKSEQVEELVNQTKAKWGRIDVLVNNAGITRDTLVLRMKLEDRQAVINFKRAVKMKITIENMS